MGAAPLATGGRKVSSIGARGAAFVGTSDGEIQAFDAATGRSLAIGSRPNLASGSLDS